VVQFSQSAVLDKVPQGSTLIFGEPFPYNTMWDRWKEASMQKSSFIHPVVLTQYWLVMDGQTDGHMTTANTALA